MCVLSASAAFHTLPEEISLDSGSETFLQAKEHQTFLPLLFVCGSSILVQSHLILNIFKSIQEFYRMNTELLGGGLCSPSASSSF